MPWIEHSAPEGKDTMRKLLLIDLGSIFYPAWHAGGDEEIGRAYQVTVESIAKMRRGYDHVAVCLDSPPYARRKALLPTYKAQRDAPTNVFLEQYRRTRERLELDGLLLLSCPGEESDDVIASAVKLAIADGLDVTVASADKDLLQLVDDAHGVRVYSPMKEKYFARGDVIEAWHVSPEMLLDSLSLQGDSSDNVPGVPKVGPVTAAKLLMKFGTLEDVFANVDKVTTPKLQEALFAGGPAVRLAKQVIRLRDDCPIEWKKIYEERVPMSLSDARDEEFDPISPPPPPSDGDGGPGIINADARPPRSEPAADKPLPQAAPVTALTVGSWDMALEPRTGNDALILARKLFDSRLFSGYGTPEAVFAVILRGRSIGLDATTSLAAFHVIEGRVTMHADLIEGLVLKSGKAESFQLVESTREVATYRALRKGGKTIEMSFTIEDAWRAGLVAKDKDGDGGYKGVSKSGKPSNWDKYRATMLRMRAKTQLARAVFPDVTLGFYTADEVTDGQVAEGEFV
jgi:5'-3' exonuclease